MTITAADDCGVTSTSSFTLTVNTPPAIAAAAAVARQQGSPATLATLATVSDAEDDDGTLVVAATSLPAGITLGPISNSGGTITAAIAASCAAATGAHTIELTVTDSFGATSVTNFTVDVTTNTPPALGPYASLTINAAAAATATPTAPPADNGSITSLTVAAPGFTGTLSIDPVTGVVSIANAAPAGTYTVTVTATDHCGVTTTSTFALVVNAFPSIVPGFATLRQGASSSVTLAAVSDAETPAGSLAVAATSVAAGITAGALTNDNGTVTALVTVACDAPTGPRAITIEVTDEAGATSSANATIDVTPNTAPLLGTYTNATLLPGGGVAVTPAAPPADDDAIASLTVSAPGFTGTLEVDAAGVVTIGNAGPAGIHSVTVAAADDCGVISTSSFTLTVNTPPAIAAAAAVARQQGSPATLATLATVSDAEDDDETLVVAATSLPAGITLGPISNSGGTITAAIAASCTAATGADTIELTVTDSFGATAITTLTVDVTANTPPALGPYASLAINAAAAATATPTAPPADNGSITSLTVAAPGFGGTLSIDAAGVVTIGNAGPPGSHTVTVAATDDCGSSASASFALTVNAPPSIAAGAAITRRQGSPPAVATLAAVTDAEDAAGTLLVTATSIPPGISLGAISNSGGTITATVEVSCTAAIGANLIPLLVTDSGGLTSTASFTIDVVANAAPMLGSYGALSLVPGEAATATPAAPPSDDGSIVSLAVSAPGFTGTLSVDAAGVVTIGNAGPSGSYTVTVTAADDCGATSTSSFLLTVLGPAILGLSPDVTCQNGEPPAIIVAGARFTPQTRVLWNGTSRVTTFLDPARLLLALDASDLAMPGQAVVRVGEPGGAPSPESVLFTVVEDSTPPRVAAPLPVAVADTLSEGLGDSGAAGATAATSPSLRAFLDQATAEDDCSAVSAPAVQMAGGAPVFDHTVFPPGRSDVEFLFHDRSGNIGAGPSAVTVYRLGALIAPTAVPGLADFLLLLNVLDGHAALGTPSHPAPPAAADVNRDGRVDANDRRMFESYLTGATASTPPSRRRAVGPAAPPPIVHRVHVESAGRVGAFRVTLRLDPALVRVVSVQPGTASAFASSLRATPAASANESGRLVILGAVTGSDGPSGALEVAVVELLEIAPAGAASVRTESVEIVPPL
ncbi:MAG TPA: hypothetical protein VNA04_16355 [Thermoanaerobaculia bacterium]|nr:hypothetical protein [Thermoanaerobaculia bacterium]